MGNFFIIIDITIHPDTDDVAHITRARGVVDFVIGRNVMALIGREPELRLLCDQSVCSAQVFSQQLFLLFGQQKS